MSIPGWKTVTIKDDVHQKLTQLSKLDSRSMSNYLTVLIDNLYETLISKEGE